MEVGVPTWYEIVERNLKGMIIPRLYDGTSLPTGMRILIQYCNLGERVPV